MSVPSYESDQLLNEYLLMHYGSDEQVMPWSFGPQEALHFPVRTVARFSDKPVARSLDLGCAVGRSSFELSRSSGEVLGLDFSANFIAAAQHLKEQGCLYYPVKEIGDRESQAVARVPDGCHSEQCHFLQGDAMNLPSDLGCFDRVHAANLICRLSDPVKLLDRLPSLVRTGGELVLATPCTWLDSFTAPDKQPGGDTFEWLRQKLDASFDLDLQVDEPFVIRETARKFQWSVSLVTRWQKR
ncbi:putative 4-mercaptohistidine N1-methyltransferase [Verrucomicrobiaceae bacterium N1E253]|uniref:Putative 4-mercaptohistidine N1-methyltransferase n=1 Tax=Oceaniferula marina TaxID=2748318 RepID=A0A851GDQ2_9BACT|nr:putative 4-mercaptohistidine N1-methyltransferase [Oceaniferula marina]NWK55546.1 putative 4-mercaptohistidine N1-methyltransferase [Oceaniferula marina]